MAPLSPPPGPLYNSLMPPPLEAMRRYPAFPRSPAISPELLDRWLSALRLTVVWVDAYTFGRSWRVGPRICADHFLVYVLRGTARVQLEDRAAELRPDWLLHVPAGTEHEIVNTSNGPLVTRTLHVQASVYGCVDFPRLVGWPRLLRAAGDRRLPGLFDEAVRGQYLRPPGWREEVRAGVYRILLHVLRQYGDRFTPMLRGRLEERSEDLERLNPVFDAIDRGYATTLRMRDLAASVNVSASHLRMIFKRATGETLVGYLQRFRLERACDLLRSTPLGVKAVAQRAGIPNEYYFYRAFKRRTGMTPLQFRAHRPV